MTPSAGKLARFWKNARRDLAQPFHGVIVFDKFPNHETTMELHRG